jgi:branched-chain amino acid transport system permease protein
VVAFLLLAVLGYVATNDYLLYLSIFSTINAIAVLGIILISGFARQLHLGQSALVGIGAYVSAILMTRLGWNFWLTVSVAVVSAAIFGVVLGIPTLKLRGGPYLALVTQTFGEIIYIVILNLEGITGGPFGITHIKSPQIGSFRCESLQSYFFLCLAFLVLAYLATRQIANSKYGRMFISIRESEAAAQSVGINTMKYKIIAFTLAAALGGLSGVLYGPFIGYLSPEQFRWQPSLILISMAIVGGLSSLEGGILGAFVITFVPELLRVTDQFRLLLYGVLLILTLAFLPDGLISLFGKSFGEIGEALRKRYAELSDKTEKIRRSEPQKSAEVV